MRKLASIRWVLFWVGWGMLGDVPAPAAPPEPAPPPPGVVFVADGGGDATLAVQGFRGAVLGAGLPWKVVPVRWTRDLSSSVLADQLDHDNQRVKGGLLAGEVLAYREAHPGHTICLAGYSAGCLVVLAAVDCLPPSSVDHIVLLQPSVSVACNLRPALRCARGGLDVTSSLKDHTLSTLASVVPSDRGGVPYYAGQYGFRGQPATPEDKALFARLRQHVWNPNVSWTGHQGGHYGATRKEYLLAYIIPYVLAP